MLFYDPSWSKPGASAAALVVTLIAVGYIHGVLIFTVAASPVRGCAVCGHDCGCVVWGVDVVVWGVRFCGESGR